MSTWAMTVWLVVLRFRRTVRHDGDPTLHAEYADAGGATDENSPFWIGPKFTFILIRFGEESCNFKGLQSVDTSGKLLGPVMRNCPSDLDIRTLDSRGSKKGLNNVFLQRWYWSPRSTRQDCRAVVGRHSREVLFFRPENQLFSTRPERKDLTIYQEMDGAILL
ncbi:hypothetical protein M407DRAFT_13160 [Tulasnella calospora MUT 4182]|uniref:Uncharacterized protein n=1 Tax=Tulasnella calospora MUT 4182 TaxID=1051891 RepID=A0A0C3Q090_9AGAM|nr:hypothetical protein M407DRAFT_13160 [Tulasnella calospora MUT 4182]